MRRLFAGLLFMSFISSPCAWAQENQRKIIPVTAVVLKNLPPYYLFEKENRPVGFAIEALDRIAVLAGLRVKYVFKENWGEIVDALLSGQADLCPFIAATADGQTKLDFTPSLVTEQVSIFVRKTTQDIRDIADLQQRRIGVVRQSAAWEFLKQKKGLNLVQIEKTGQALFELLSGQVDALVVPEQVFRAMARKSGVEEHLKIAGKPLFEISRTMAVRKGNRELWERLAPAVRTFVNSGDYRTIFTQWFGTPTSFWTTGRIIWIMIGNIVACLMIMAVWRYKTTTKLNRQLVENIAEREKVEEEGRNLVKRFHLLLEFAGDDIHVHDLNGNLVVSSDSFRRMLGFTEEESRALNVVNWDAYFDKEDFLRRVRLQGSKPLVFETKHRREDGTEFNIEITSIGIEVDGLPYIYSITRDITERKRMEEALRESENRYRDLFQNAIMGIFKSTIDGKAVMVNPMLARMFGYETTQEFMARVKNVVTDVLADPRRRSEIIRLQIDNPGLNTFENLYRRKDGSTFWGRLNVRSIKDDYDRVIFYEGFLEDISERRRAEEEKKKLEERLQRAEKMEALGTLAGGVAHDLNNVLGIIVGYAEILLLDSDVSGSQRPALKNILEGSQKAAVIIQDLLTLARRGVAFRRVININKIVTEVFNSPEFEKLSAQHHQLKTRIDIDPDLLNISGSSVHLSKALFNLASNAGEAMPAGGTLTIKTANQYLDRPIQGYDDVREGDYAVLSVSDTGEGISSSDLKRIFEPFYTKKVMGRSGTGLGLAVVWGTVKDHQGYINVQSEEGKGSTFTLYFPVTREDMPDHVPAVPVIEYQGKGETILVVDDVRGQRELAEVMLRKLNYRPVSVSSGEEAVAYLRDHSVDLLVLDMIMDPGMDGLDTYARILEIRPGQKAIIVSGFSESDRVHLAQALGAGAYLKKPYVREKLGLAVRKELDRPI
jgi:PAS domain S-box-containing protein